MRQAYSRLAMTTALLGLLASEAQAQRTSSDAVTNADDAFGSTVGDERIGMYNPQLVRGFSPEAAGNVRIDGLYFDQRSFITQRVIDGVTVRVGIAAQGYPFAAPTGIADYSLRKPGDKFVAATALNYGPYSETSAELDMRIPIDGDRLGITAGIAFYEDGSSWASRPKYDTYGLSLRYRPSDNFSVQPFWGRIDYRDEVPQPLFFVTGPFLPKPYDRSVFSSQEWSGNRGRRELSGAVVKGNVGGIIVEAGLFNSLDRRDRTYADLWFGTDINGRASDRTIVIDADNRQKSLSGELRLSTILRDGPRRHRIYAMARGRELDRRYGGSALVNLGVSQIGVVDQRPEPQPVFGPKTFDAVRQTNLGLGYELRWANVGEISLGIQRADYKKQVRQPAGALPASKSKPWLLNAAAAVQLRENLSLYGSYAKGLEESDIAPANATNRFEAPPAILTKQYDGGLRWVISPSVSAVAGYFDVSKPFFNLDANSRFRELGTIRNKGLEFSLSGQVANGLRIVAGTIYLDQQISGEPVDRGIIGSRPIGSFRLHTIVNANWQLPWHPPLTLTTRIERATSRPADALNSFQIPERTLLSLGARYRTNVGKVPVLVRVTADNITDNFGWAAGGSGFLLTNAPRRYELSLAADF
jgi:iron complex outermembrane recepter protein